jgi:hypothetical protein
MFPTHARKFSRRLTGPARRVGRQCSCKDRWPKKEGELGFLFIFKTLMWNLNKFNIDNSKSPNSKGTS